MDPDDTEFLTVAVDWSTLPAQIGGGRREDCSCHCRGLIWLRWVLIPRDASVGNQMLYFVAYCRRDWQDGGHRHNHMARWWFRPRRNNETAKTAYEK